MLKPNPKSPERQEGGSEIHAEGLRVTEAPACTSACDAFARSVS